MRLLARHFPAFLTLLVPLALLAWLGSREMSRLEVRADRLLDDQAQGFVADVSNRIERHATTKADELLDNLPDLGLLRLVHAAQALRQRDPDVLDLLVVDPEGRLVFPRVSPDALEGLPYHWTSPSVEIGRAEVLEAFGDLVGAREELERLLAEYGDAGPLRFGREDVLVRARFTLARVLRAQGEREQAAELFRRVIVDTVPRPGPLRDRPRVRTTDAAAGVLAELALAQLDAERGRGLQRTGALMRDIAAGVHDDVADALLVEVLAILEAAIPEPSSLRAGADEALRTDEVRREGRAFADEYRAFVQQAVGRKIRHGDERTRLMHAHAGPDGASLLALRPLTDEEREHSLEFIGDASWIGVRLDLEHLLDAALGDARNEGRSGFRLVVSDGDGVPFDAEQAPATDEPRATTGSLAGIQLAAIPIDPAALVSERQRSDQNRALLLVVLCLTAGAGAFLLVRSVAREAEFAAARLRFVSQVSHELKTPLALIKMYGETLALGRASDAEQSAHFAGIVTREADHLSALVDRVLDFSRGQEGTLVLHPEPLELAPILERIADEYRPHLIAEGVILAVDCERGLVAAVDEAALESAMVALIENAVKYGPAPAEIEVSLARSGDDVHLEVADRGIGIPSGERRRVFEGFYRASNSGGRRGAGLGLSLVRRFAEGHGGRAEALPRDGGGTIVRISLPLHHVHPREGTTTDVQDQRSRDRGRARSS